MLKNSRVSRPRLLSLRVQQRSSQSVAALRRASSQTQSVPYLSKRLQAKNVLRSLDAVVPRIINYGEPRNEAWSSRFDNAEKILSGESLRPVIAVWGCDPKSSRGLVTALLDDPLSSEETWRTALIERHNRTTPQTILRTSFNGFDSQALPLGTEPLDELRLPSSWLQSTRAQIIEISSGDPELIISQFLRSDINIIVVSSPDQLERSSTRRVLESLSSKLALFMVIDTLTLPSAYPAAPYSYHDLVKPFIETDGDSRLYFVSSEQALNTLNSFRHFHFQESLEHLPASTRATSVDRFHTDLISSGIPRLSKRIDHYLQGFHTPSDLPPLRMATALHTASSALHASKSALNDAKREIDLVRYQIQEMRSMSKETARRYRSQILNDGEAPITDSTKMAKHNVELYFSSLPWWKLPWRVDDFPTDVAQILTAMYGKELERHLIFHTGRLATLQAEQDARIQEMLHLPDSRSPLYAPPLLVNSIEQLTSSTALHSTALTSPITRRLGQLTSDSNSNNALAQLHRRTQILLLQSYGLSFGGAGAAWGSWAGGYAGEEMALGVGLLGVLVGLRWAAGGWERVKRRWWETWSRVDDGLSRDLHNQFEDVMQKMVLAKIVRTCDEFEGEIQKREDSILHLSTEVVALEDEVRCLGAEE